MRDGSARQLRSGRARAGRLSLLTDGMGSATDSGSGCTARLLTPAMICNGPSGLWAVSLIEQETSVQKPKWGR